MSREKKQSEEPEEQVVTAVLKVDMHCDGCASRIRRYPGVEGVAMEVDKGSMTVVGRFDAEELRDRVAKKTRKTVDLVGGGGEDNNNPVMPVVATVVLQIGSMGLHCDGCKNRIRNILLGIEGVEEVRMDIGKDQVKVTGTMDAKALPEKLHKKLRRPVDVVAPIKARKDVKEKDVKEESMKAKDDKEDGGSKDGEEPAALRAELEAWKSAFYDQQSLINAELLSDENPNACAIM